MLHVIKNGRVSLPCPVLVRTAGDRPMPYCPPPGGGTLCRVARSGPAGHRGGGNVGGSQWVDIWVGAQKRERTPRAPQAADLCAVSCGRYI